MNPGFKYPSPGCEVETPEASSDVQKMFLEAHLKAAHSELLQVSVQPVSEPSGGFTAQKLQRPYIPEDCTENQWSFVLDK